MFSIYTKINGKLVSWQCSDDVSMYEEAISYVKEDHVPKNHKTPILALFESKAKNDETPPPVLERA